MSLFPASEASPFFSEFFTLFVIKGWTRAGGSGLDSSRSRIHSVIPLFRERLFPLFLGGARLRFSLVPETRLNPHIGRMMFHSSPFPVTEGLGGVKLGHINGQRRRKSIDEHVNDGLVGQIVSSETG